MNVVPRSKAAISRWCRGQSKARHKDGAAVGQRQKDGAVRNGPRSRCAGRRRARAGTSCGASSPSSPSSPSCACARPRRRPQPSCPHHSTTREAAISHSVGFVLIRAADFSATSAQAPRPHRQALIKTIWRGSDRVVQGLGVVRAQQEEGAAAVGSISSGQRKEQEQEKHEGGAGARGA